MFKCYLAWILGKFIWTLLNFISILLVKFPCEYTQVPNALVTKWIAGSGWKTPTMTFSRFWPRKWACLLIYKLTRNLDHSVPLSFAGNYPNRLSRWTPPSDHLNSTTVYVGLGNSNPKRSLPSRFGCFNKWRSGASNFCIIIILH